jgi:hypothetical protein
MVIMTKRREDRQDADGERGKRDIAQRPAVSCADLGLYPYENPLIKSYRTTIRMRLGNTVHGDLSRFELVVLTD